MIPPAGSSFSSDKSSGHFGASGRSRRQFLRGTLVAGGSILAGATISQLRGASEAVPRQEKKAGKFPTNGDEATYATSHISSFTKGLPRDDLGVVTPSAFKVLTDCLAEGPQADYEMIPTSGRFRLANPQAAFALAMEGYEPANFLTALPPTLASAEMAGEAVELYWQALLRDVGFADYASDPGVASAVAEMNRLKEFRGPREKEKVTPATLFRGPTAGDLNGPYISQFLLLDVPYGATKIVQRYKVPPAGDDHLVKYEAWLNCQRGYFSKEATPFDPEPRYLRNGRDLGEFVRRDFCNQAFLNATLILMGEPYPKKTLRVPFSQGFPYLESETQTAFATFGGPWVVDNAMRVCNLALKAAWHDKWIVHRRGRPEEFGGHLHNRVTGRADYPFHADLLNSEALQRSHEKFGTYLLPQAYTDGCPLHPSYPAGHGVAGGSCITVLKALFDGSYVFPKPVMPAPDGRSLVPYDGPPLTVAGELNKLAANVAIGRNFAGIHWRSDAWAGMLQGEAVALEFLRRQRAICPEKFPAWKVTTFAGKTIEV